MYAALIDEYLTGTDTIRRTVDELTDAELDAHPIDRQWSIRQVICHIADFEMIYADRMKRVIFEERPALAGGDPGSLAAGLAYGWRTPIDELQVIESVRRQMAVILRSLPNDAFRRVGVHPRDGSLTLTNLLQRITNHVPHHLRFIEAKRRALASIE